MRSSNTATTAVVLAMGGNEVGELVLNRPNRKNSLTPEVAKQLLAGLRTLEADDAVKAIVLRGSGAFFCAGLDLKEMAKHRKETNSDGGFGEAWRVFHKAMYICSKPTICCLEGGAIAGGTGLALSADYIITDESAFFHVAEVNFGMAAPWNVIWLTLKFGAAAAMWLAVGGQRLDGTELERRGIALRAVDGNALEESRALAGLLAKNDGKAMRLNKEMIQSVQLGDGGFDVMVDRVMGLARAGGARGPPRPESRLKGRL